jgi:hypothetical protein
MGQWPQVLQLVVGHHQAAMELMHLQPSAVVQLQQVTTAPRLALLMWRQQ